MELSFLLIRYFSLSFLSNFSLHGKTIMNIDCNRPACTSHLSEFWQCKSLTCIIYRSFLKPFCCLASLPFYFTFSINFKLLNISHKLLRVLSITVVWMIYNFLVSCPSLELRPHFKTYILLGIGVFSSSFVIPKHI